MRIAFVLQPPVPDGPVMSAVTAETIGRLRGYGIEVDLLVPEAGCLELAEIRPTHDLYVLKSKSTLTLSWAGVLTRAGAVTVNTWRSCSLAKDKIAATALLSAAGVAVPPSWATGSPGPLRPLLNEGPLWIKPHRGSRGIGVSRVETSMELDRQARCTDAHNLPLPLFVQREVPSGGRDLKVYVVGDWVSALTRQFPARTVREKLGTPIPISTEVRAAALACGRALGLELYGVDFLLHGDRFHVVDVNPYPGYKGAAEASSRLAGYLIQRARRPHAWTA